MNQHSIDVILVDPQRKLIVSKANIDLSKPDNNEIFILMVQESRGSAGGRGGGSGNRKISRIIAFECNNGICINNFDTQDQEIIDRFDIPYSAVAMDILLSNGKPLVVQGIVDPEMIGSYHDLMHNLK